MLFQTPRLVIAALRGGSGKTIVSLGLIAAWRIYNGLRIIPFKKGPDYIDAGWLAKAGRNPCYNLDPYLMKPDEMLASFIRRSCGADGSLIEGNRGLYDGVDARGSFSTAELAKFLRAPVVLVLDATKMTGTAAALVLGCRHLDPQVHIAGVILNRIAGKRHERVVREAIEESCQIPVVGVIPKDANNFFPERHLGLVPHQESSNAAEAMEFAAQKMRECLDLDALWRIAGTAGPLGWPATLTEPLQHSQAHEPFTIGVLRDAAFQFYYPENLEALQEKGAILKEISSFDNRALPCIDALYIGGGFPETHLEILSKNRVFRESLKHEIESGLPVYAECGGLMFLCRSIHHQEQAFPMTGVFPLDIVMEPKPQGHGYTQVECVRDNPYFARGTAFRGHEFHYSRVIDPDSVGSFIFRLKKGHGIVAGWDGLCYKNALASYTHIHAAGNEQWADAMVRVARWYQQERSGRSLDRKSDPEQRMLGAYQYLTAL